MISALKWLWGKILAFLKVIAGFVRDCWVGLKFLLSSAIAWMVAGLAYAIDLLFGWIGDMLENAMEQFEVISLPGVQWLPFAQWLACDVCALDVAYTAFATYFAIWVATRLVRGSWSAIRVVLDII